ncbi:NfeD family protein [Nodosilinea sp. LEGE 07088]|uniref:NfeD family protein n=1 Tax=Nodosilinea sp. LEGE 07088 TaxID=2777968 RepID=UPI00187EB33E|nr:NfeD family protein [Nodosilinea sp. LEGE 07088]MBE9141323.1 NfeD family protein [Nodosilinea sp. LEGE 07088]
MNYPLFWAVLGAIFCLMELFLPTGFVESTLGLSAFLVAVMALAVPSFSFQIVAWVVLSLICLFLLRRFVPKRTPYSLQESTEARTLTAIPPGQTGRVIYEGNSWQARCDDETVTIGADQPVVVLHRKGNTLYVLPESALRA